jgi:SAM-dependent methyltransferase
MSDPQDETPIALDAYESLAGRYDALAPTKAHNAYYDRPATLSLLPEVRGKRVLDAGCGPGIYSEWLLEQGAEVVAFDVSPKMIEYYQRRNGDRAPVLLADLEKPLGFLSNASVDIVLAALSLDYVRDWRPTFREFARVLRERGYVVASLGHPAADYFVYHREGNYFEVEHVVEHWRFGGDEPLEMHRYRHPLGHLFEALFGAGLTLDRFLEPRPTEQFREANPEEYDDLMRQPGFLCVRARKLPIQVS